MVLSCINKYEINVILYKYAIEIIINALVVSALVSKSIYFKTQ